MVLIRDIQSPPVLQIVQPHVVLNRLGPNSVCSLNAMAAHGPESFWSKFGLLLEWLGHA